MALNCKAGDLAVVVRGTPSKNIGRILRVVSLAEPIFGYQAWNVEGERIRFADDCLRPIRDQPGTDESIDWAPVPAKREGVPA